MNKPLHKLFFVVAMAATAIFVIDAAAWAASGVGIFEHVIGGESSPLILAIASHITWMPHWAFWLVCLAAVVVLSVLISLVLMSFYAKELQK